MIGEMGHLTPIIRLMDALEEYGHQTVLFTMLHAKEKAEKMMGINGVKGKLVTPDNLATRTEAMFGKKFEDIQEGEEPLMPC